MAAIFGRRRIRLILIGFLGGVALLAGCVDQEEKMQSVIIDLQVEAGDMAAIADRQKAVQAKAEEAGVNLSNVQTYRLLPQLAADMDGEAALFLLTLEEVAALRPDRTKSIQD